ncbi:MAG: glycoside hydrolase domain-containing protein [Ethanoligenens sp.]
MDQMVLEVQQWLNTTYGSNSGYSGLFPGGISENGVTGTQVEQALITALQIEEGISSPTGTFGPTTTADFTTMTARTSAELSNPPTNKEYILQGGFWCKGYNPGGFSGIFYTGTQSAVEQFQADAGLSTQDGIVTAMIMKALLNTDPFVLSSGGDTRIREIQQDLNNRYNAYTGLLPTNGIYVAATNKALIYALQAEEGLSTSVANGSFGPTTISKCPTLSAGDSRTNFVKILEYALYCNHYDPGDFSGVYGSSVTSAVESFQSFMCLPVTGVANMGTIKATLTSNGDTSRSAQACDCATILTAAKAATLVNNGYTHVGRYLTGTAGGVSKALTAEEVQIIFSAGLTLFVIYESHGTTNSYFTSSQGSSDAYAAIAASQNLGVPSGTVIYFAVDYDALDSQVTSNVLPYFQAIKSYFDNYNTQSYQVGIYGDRNVASRVCNNGYAVYSFVADMSTGYSGNIGYTMPTNWSFDQFYTVTIGSGAGQIEIDKDAYSGQNSGITEVTVSANTPQVNNQPSVQPTAATKQDPVDTSTGAHMLQLTALNVHGAIDLSLNLSYSSAKLASGTLGKGWYHNYEIKVVPVYSSYYVYWNPSVYSVFTVSSTGSYTCSDLGKQNDVLTVNSNGTFTLNLNNDTIYSFNSSGVLTQVQNRTGMNITVSSDTSGDLVLTEPVSGQTLTVSYNTSGLVGSVSDKSGRTANFGYDSNACLTTVTDANGKSTTFTYDANGHVLTGTDGDSVLFFTDTYDSAGRIATQKDAITGSNASTFSYDTTSVSGELIVTVTDRNGNTSKNVFNSSTLQLVSAADENGNTTTYTYDTNGNLASETDALGNATITTYDSQNHPLVVTDKTGSKTTNTYDAKGNKLTVTNPDGGQITYTYNSSNRVTSTTDLRGTQTAYTYDSNGLLTEKDYGSEKTINSYTTGLLTKSTDPNGNVTVYAYDAAGRLTSVTDAEENVTVYTYDAVGNQLSKTDPLGEKVSATYSSRSVVLTRTDANGNITTSVYNGNLKVVSVTDPKGNKTTYSYDGEDHLIQTTDAQGHTVLATYDPAGRVLSRTDAVGNTAQYTYDAVGNVLTMTNSKGGVTTDTYYANGKKKTETDPAGNQTTYGYDSGWRLNAATNSLGKTTSYVYSNAGDLSSVTDPLANKTSYTYDAYGNRLTTTAPNGNVTTNTYDLNNNQTSVKDALGNTTTYTYDVLNHRIKVTDANVHSTTTAYDAVGRVVSQTDALGNTSSVAYDSNGNVIEQTDALGNAVSQTTYDTTNLPITVKDALDNTTLNTYDSLRRLTRTEDPLTNITAYGYDANGKITSATDPLNGVSSASYDADGNQTSVTNPLGGAFSYGYDDSNRSTSESTTSGGTISYTYNALNLLSEMLNARSQKRDYTYDDAGRIKSFTDPEGTTSYTYDANGNILTVTDAVGTITRQYDALNRVAKVTDTSGNVVQYTYDAVGNLASLIYPDGKTVSYTYDADNRMLTVTDWASRITRYAYDANGRLTQTTRPDGSVLTQSYDTAGRLTSAVDKDSSGNTISNYSYTYDANGNILTEDLVASSTDNASMTYDALNRLTAKGDKDASGNALASYGYAYDADGNITSGTSSQQTTTLTYDNLDRLSSYNSQTPTFDLDGNMTACVLSGSTVNFTYDSGNRLTQAGTTAYVYDANDNRVSATTSGQKLQYVYENVAAKLSQLLVHTAADGSETTYIYGLGLIGHQDSSGYSTYHYDYRGSTVALTNTSGTVTDRFTYGAYGEILTHTGSSDTLFQYNGRDGVTTESNSIYYMRARFYVTSIQRFANADTLIGTVQNSSSLNRYAYANDNPINNVDPSGKFVQILIGAAIGALIGGGLDAASQIATNVIEHKTWYNINAGEVLVNMGTGALSGALAGTGVGILGSVLLNAGLSEGNYVATNAVKGDANTLSGSIIATSLGAVGGGIGGEGMLKNSDVQFYLQNREWIKLLNNGWDLGGDMLQQIFSKLYRQDVKVTAETDTASSIVGVIENLFSNNKTSMTK